MKAEVIQNFEGCECNLYIRTDWISCLTAGKKTRRLHPMNTENQYKMMTCRETLLTRAAFPSGREITDAVLDLILFQVEGLIRSEPAIHTDDEINHQI